nr:hypothetical protein [Phenylobacterium immobile]
MKVKEASKRPRRLAELHDQIVPRLLVDAGWGFFRDAFVTAEFAKKRGATSVRTLPDKRPDFEMELNGRLHRFEVTEADDPERKRSAKYKAALQALDAGATVRKDDPQENSERRISLISEALAKAAMSKAHGDYGTDWGLVIRLNLSGYRVVERKSVKVAWTIDESGQ